MGDLSRRSSQPDRALRDFFRIGRRSQPRRKSSVALAFERLPDRREADNKPLTSLAVSINQAQACWKSCRKSGDLPKSSTLRIGSYGAHRGHEAENIGLVFCGGRPLAAPRFVFTARQRAERPGHRLVNRSIEKERQVQVLVRDNNVDQALKVLKKKMQREGVFREMKLRGHYEKPSERRVREKAEAIRRARKLARKKLQREGLLPMKPRPVPGAAGRGGPVRAPRPPRF
jgi:small subunit ribosomal protein S21